MTTAVAGTDALCEQISAAPVVVPVGSRTHSGVGGPAPEGEEVRAPAGVIAYDPAELTVTVGAGTTVAELADALGAGGQECVLDPRDPHATVGGVLASGLSGHRRLRYGPLRDRLLEVRFVTGEGRVVKAGGPTVKNVTGYDLPRLLVGSLGTIGLMVRVTLRCQPLPRRSAWAVTSGDPFEVRRRCFRASSILWDGTTTTVLIEGEAGDIETELDAGGLAPVDDTKIAFPEGPCRGRVSVRPKALAGVAGDLGAIGGLRWLAEVGVGTVHVAADDPGSIERARQAVEEAGGWLLREAGDGIDGFGAAGLPNRALMARIKDAFDPSGKFSPGRLPL